MLGGTIGRMGCALQWAFAAEQSIGHGRTEQPPLQERGRGGVRFTVSCNAAVTCSTAKLMLVANAVAEWGYWQNAMGRMGCRQWEALQWAFSAEQSRGHGCTLQPLL